MKRTIALLVLLLTSVGATNLTGKWSGSFKVDGGDHNVPQWFIFRQDGNNLTGSGGPDATEQYSLENGKVDGNRVRFALTTGEWSFNYDLEADGKKLAGNLELKSLNDRRTAKVSLTKTD